MSDQRAKFEAWYVQHMKDELSATTVTAEDISEMRDGGTYGDRGYLNGCWSRWQSQAAEIERLRAALTRISCAAPDRLDHARDVAIVERAAHIARAALSPSTSQGVAHG